MRNRVRHVHTSGKTVRAQPQLLPALAGINSESPSIRIHACGLARGFADEIGHVSMRKSIIPDNSDPWHLQVRSFLRRVRLPEKRYGGVVKARQGFFPAINKCVNPVGMST